MFSPLCCYCTSWQLDQQCDIGHVNCFTCSINIQRTMKTRVLSHCKHELDGKWCCRTSLWRLLNSNGWLVWHIPRARTIHTRWQRIIGEIRAWPMLSTRQWLVKHWLTYRSVNTGLSSDRTCLEVFLVLLVRNQRLTAITVKAGVTWIARWQRWQIRANAQFGPYD